MLAHPEQLHYLRARLGARYRGTVGVRVGWTPVLIPRDGAPGGGPGRLGGGGVPITGPSPRPRVRHSPGTVFRRRVSRGQNCPVVLRRSLGGKPSVQKAIGQMDQLCSYPFNFREDGLPFRTKATVYVYATAAPRAVSLPEFDGGGIRRS